MDTRKHRKASVAVVVAVLIFVASANEIVIAQDEPLHDVLAVLDGRLYMAKGVHAYYKEFDRGRSVRPLEPIGTESAPESSVGSVQPDYHNYVAGENMQYYSADEQGNVIVIDNPDERAKWKSFRVRSSTRAETTTYTRVFRNMGVEKERYMGKDYDHPLKVKDKSGKEHDFLPIILVPRDKAMGVKYIDYSGK